MRLDHRTQHLPRHDLLHRCQQHVAFGRVAVVWLESGALIGCHGKGLLLYRAYNVIGLTAMDLFSVALFIKSS